MGIQSTPPVAVGASVGVHSHEALGEDSPPTTASKRFQKLVAARESYVIIRYEG